MNSFIIAWHKSSKTEKPKGFFYEED